MKLERNNNQHCIKHLSRMYSRKNKITSLLIILSIILTTFLLTSVFSIGISFFNTIQRQGQLIEGASYNAVISQLSRDQKERLESDDTVDYVGETHQCGLIQSCNGKVAVRMGLMYRDQTNWEKQCLPVVLNVQGYYPKMENEVMMSRWALEECGIFEYIPGMEITFSFSSLGKTEDKVFKVTGTYEDYTFLNTDATPGVLVSKAFYEKYPEDGGEGLNYVSYKNILGYFYDDQLVREIHLEKNQGYWPRYGAYYSLWRYTAGVGGMAILIMVCGYLFIYNIVNLSVSKNTRFYGLLKTLGMTVNQMRLFMRRQIYYLAVPGILIGLFLGGAVSFVLVPWILKVWARQAAMPDSMYTVSFHPAIFIGALVFAFITVSLGIRKSVETAASIAPVEAVKYVEGQSVGKKRLFFKKNKLLQMAWANVFRIKKRAIFVFASMFISCAMFLGIHGLTSQDSAQNYIVDALPWDAYFRNKSGDTIGLPRIHKFSKEILEEIKGMEGVADVEAVSSNKVVMVNDPEVFEEYLKAFYEKWMRESYETGMENMKENPEIFYSYVIGIGEDELENLNQKLDKPVDIDKFMDGEICVCGMIQMEDYGVNGKTIRFYEEGETPSDSHTMQVGQWLNNIFGISSFAGIAPDIYVSNKVAEKLFGDPWIEEIRVRIDNPEDGKLNKTLEAMVKGDEQIGYTSRLNWLSNMASTSRSKLILGNGISVILAVIGVLNFMNVVFTGIANRKQEFAVMESIGMTGRQLRKMILLEGVVYWGINMALVSTLGIGFEYMLCNLFADPGHPFYFTPVPLLFIGVISLLICLGIPGAALKQTENSSIVDRIREIQK